MLETPRLGGEAPFAIGCKILSLLPAWRLCRNEEIRRIVILNEVKNLIISTESIIEILRLLPQNDITTQSLEGGRLG